MTDVRFCPRCGDERTPDDPYTRSQPYCKPCRAEYQRERYRAVAARRERHQRQARQWAEDNPARVLEIKREANKRDKAKKHARNALYGAVAAGRVTKPDACSRCGGHPVEAHHPDYNQPLEVEWLCKACHEGTHHYD